MDHSRPLLIIFLHFNLIDSLGRYKLSATRFKLLASGVGSVYSNNSDTTTARLKNKFNKEKSYSKLFCPLYRLQSRDLRHRMPKRNFKWDMCQLGFDEMLICTDPFMSGPNPINPITASFIECSILPNFNFASSKRSVASQLMDKCTLHLCLIFLIWTI